MRTWASTNTNARSNAQTITSASLRFSGNVQKCELAGLPRRPRLSARNDRQAERDKDSDLASKLSELAIHGAICLAVSLLDRYYCCRAYRHPVGARGRSEKQREQEVAQPGKTRQGAYACELSLKRDAQASLTACTLIPSPGKGPDVSLLRMLVSLLQSAQ
jgi:hypothetical protein